MRPFVSPQFPVSHDTEQLVERTKGIFFPSLFNLRNVFWLVKSHQESSVSYGKIKRSKKRKKRQLELLNLPTSPRGNPPPHAHCDIGLSLPSPRIFSGFLRLSSCQRLQLAFRYKRESLFGKKGDTFHAASFHFIYPLWERCEGWHGGGWSDHDLSAATVVLFRRKKGVTAYTSRRGFTLAFWPLIVSIGPTSNVSDPRGQA